MTCAQVYEHLSDILDGAVPPEVNLHLAACGECATLIARLREDRAALAELPATAVPPLLLSNVMREVSKVSRPKHAWRFFVPRLAPVAAALLFTVLSYNLDLDLRPSHLRGEQIQVQSAEVARQGAAEDTARVFSTAEVPPNEDARLAAAWSEPRPWLATSVAGGTVFALWSTVVYVWYKRRANESP